MLRLTSMAVLLLAASMSVVSTGCAAMVFTSPAYPVGGIYSDISGPLLATGNNASVKTGTSEMVSVLGILAYGDASIRTAMRNGEITKIHHVDYKMTQVLGIYAKYTVVVYGE